MGKMQFDVSRLFAFLSPQLPFSRALTLFLKQMACLQENLTSAVTLAVYSTWLLIGAQRWVFYLF